MAANPRQFVSDLREGDVVDAVFCVSGANQRKTRAGAPYMDFELKDRTGSVAAKLWDVPQEFSDTYPAGTFVKVRGTVQSYRNQIQINITGIGKVPPEEVDLSDFIAHTPGDIDKMLGQVRSLLSRIENPHLAELCDSFIRDDGFCAVFRRAPAATKYHHAYIGGLLEHTLQVMRLAVKATTEYPRLDPDIMLGGAFLHDVGKVREYELGTTLGHTDEGRLMGHLILGVEMLDERARKVEGFPEELRMGIVHIILSHHGMKEWGAAVLPKTLEAVALHYLDNLDARMNLFLAAIDQSKEPDNAWTAWSNIFGTELYKGRPRR